MNEITYCRCCHRPSATEEERKKIEAAYDEEMQRRDNELKKASEKWANFFQPPCFLGNVRLLGIQIVSGGIGGLLYWLAAKYGFKGDILLAFFFGGAVCAFFPLNFIFRTKPMREREKERSAKEREFAHLYPAEGRLLGFSE